MQVFYSLCLCLSPSPSSLSQYLSVFSGSFFPSAFSVFPTPPGFSVPCVFVSISEAAWYHSHHNEETASEKGYAHGSQVGRRGTRRRAMPGWREGSGIVVTGRPLLSQKAVPSQKSLHFKADWGTV